MPKKMTELAQKMKAASIEAIARGRAGRLNVRRDKSPRRTDESVDLDSKEDTGES